MIWVVQVAWVPISTCARCPAVLAGVGTTLQVAALAYVWWIRMMTPAAAGLTRSFFRLATVVHGIVCHVLSDAA